MHMSRQDLTARFSHSLILSVTTPEEQAAAALEMVMRQVSSFVKQVGFKVLLKGGGGGGHTLHLLPPHQ